MGAGESPEEEESSDPELLSPLEDPPDDELPLSDEEDPLSLPPEVDEPLSLLPESEPLLLSPLPSPLSFYLGGTQSAGGSFTLAVMNSQLVAPSSLVNGSQTFKKWPVTLEILYGWHEFNFISLTIGVEFKHLSSSNIFHVSIVGY